MADLTLRPVSVSFFDQFRPTIITNGNVCAVVVVGGDYFSIVDCFQQRDLNDVVGFFRARHPEGALRRLRHAS